MLLLPLVLLASGCAVEEPPAAPKPPRPDAAAPDGTGGLAVVLPPVDGIAPEERDRLREAVDRALQEALPPGADPAGVVLLEPADTDVVVDVVERAVRRVGPGGTVCVLGAGMRDQVASILTLYPATRACMIPAAPIDDDGMMAADVDLERLGRALGVAAAGAAGDGTVLLLDAGDGMLDRRWRVGVTSGVRDPDAGSSSVRLLTVRSAEEALRLLDDQAALLADGIVPGSPGALEGPLADDDADPLDPDVLPPARALPPVAVVVLDASSEAALLVEVVSDRALLVIGPHSLLTEDESDDSSILLRWRIRWHIPLAALFRAALSGDGMAPIVDELLVLDPGPAAFR